MDPAAIDTLAEHCFDQAALPARRRREPIRVWALSGVERVHLPDGSTVFLKYAADPFTDEARVLTHVAAHGLPVPKLLASAQRPGLLAMVMEDLGEPVRDAGPPDAAHVAASVHRTPSPSGLRRLDAAGLAGLPKRCVATHTELTVAGRWSDTADIGDGLDRLVDLADRRAADAELPPWGLCHSEFHPTSIHIGTHGWRVLDWARAFTGPGLLDLASWQNTTEAPNLAAFDNLVDAYIATGGPDTARANRGGLPAARWAYGWHRVWVIDWYLQQCTTWIADPAQDTLYQQTIRRHLTEALQCLATNS